MFYSTPPFELGKTFKGTNTVDGTSSLVNEDVLGTIHYFAAKNPADDSARPTGRFIKAVAIRNTSGITLLPKRLVKLSATAGYYGLKEAIGYQTTLAEKNLVLVDPFLPSAGVADDDIFWGILEGSCLALTPMVNNNMNGAITVGSYLIATTGTTSQATTGGRVGNLSIANATSAQDALDQALGIVGRALSARTSDNTNADILVELMLKF